LVEVLIATTILALILAATLSAMRTLAQVDRRVVETTARVDGLRAVSGRLRSLLEQAHAGGGGIGSGGTWAGLQALSSSYFEGGANQVTWMAPLSGAGGLSGLHYLRLRRQGQRLYLDIADYDPRETEPDWNQRLVSARLLDGVESFAIDYRRDLRGTWEQRFENENGALPQAVRVRISARDRYWPDLVVAPAAYRQLN
jgi:general secretion pathway protein J